MAKKEWTEQERWELAGTLYQIIGADIDYDEEQAIYDAIHIISPEFAKELDERDQALEDYFYTLRLEAEFGLDKTNDSSKNEKREKDDK